MKLARIMIVALALTLLAASTSFGAVIAFRTGTLNEMAVNAQTGLGGNIGLVPLVGGSIPANEIVTYTFTHPISSVTDLAITINGTRVAYGSSAFAPTPVAIGALPATLVVDATHLALAFNADVAVTASTTMIQIEGLRFNVAATGAVGDRVSATITSALGQVAVTAPDVDIAILREPITVTVASTDILSNLLTTGGTASATIAITELFTNGFETYSATYPTQIKLAITVPSTLTLTDVSLVAPTAPLAAARYTTATANPAIFDITGQDSNSIESLRVVLTFTAATTPVSLAPGAVNVQATLYPSTTTFPVALGTGAITTTAPATGRLRFAERLRPTPALAINFGVTSLTSDLLSLFNVYMAAATGFAGYDTGIAIQNASPVLIGAINPGTIAVNLYKSTGAAVVSYTTSATIRPGTGLSADGQLASGATWSVLLSQLLAAAPTPITGDWEGMIHFHTNFSGATGINYIADPYFAVQAQGYQMVDVKQWKYLTTQAAK